MPKGVYARNKPRKPKQGKPKYGEKAVYNTRLYRIWGNMKQRCNNSKNTYFDYYGGRGIKVCSEWMGFFAFYEWAESNGYEETLTLDRTNSNGNYEPSNCKWVTRREQMNNTRRNVVITINGVTKTAKEWAEFAGINQNTFNKRYYKGLTGEDLLKPIDRRYSRGSKKCG